MKYLVTCLIGLLLCSSCVNDLEKVKALSEKGSGVEVAREVKTYYYGPNGKLKGILTAPVLYRYMRDTPYMDLDSGLKVNFYNDSLQLQTILTAKKGRYFEKSNDIVVRDSVVVTTVDGKKLLTEELHWDPKKQQFYTDSPARLITASQDLTGEYGLVAPADLSWYKFMSASGELKMDSTYSMGAPADSTVVDSTTPPPLPVAEPPKDSVRARKDTTHLP